MQPHEIQRALRLITSSEFKRMNRFPLAVLAQLAGLSRAALYDARNGRGITERITQTLAPLLEAIVTGRLKAKRGHRRWTVEESMSSVGKGEIFPS